MATVSKVIERAMELHPDTIDDCVKCRWLSELDGKIMRETMHRQNFNGYSFPEDQDTELVVKPPFDNLYELYIIAMSDFFSGEIGSYSASAIMFEEAYSDFKKDYLRNNVPPSKDFKLFKEE